MVTNSTENWLSDHTKIIHASLHTHFVIIITCFDLYTFLQFSKSVKDDRRYTDIRGLLQGRKHKT